PTVGSMTEANEAAGQAIDPAQMRANNHLGVANGGR
ncbi:hypothetical protein FHS42_006034, partial [Streptomyces zagrosensis]|nr:hypothetical protein [Streptomyces zagrosensis]